MQGIIAIGVALSAGSPGADTLVDYTVAEVDGSIITRSELAAEARLTLLRGYGVDVARNAELSDALLAALLEAVVHRKLVLAELRRLQMEQVPQAALESARRALRTKFSRPEEQGAFWLQVGLSRHAESYDGAVPPALEAILREEIAVDRFLDVRIRAGIVLDDKDIIRCFEANARVFAGRRIAEVRERIRTRLRQEQEDAALGRLLVQLKERSDLRYPTLLKPTSGEKEPPPFRCPSRGH